MSMRPPAHVRWRPDVGWELQCDNCLDYWPLAEPGEFWMPARTMQRCLACIRVVDRVRARDARRDDTYRARGNSYRLIKRQAQRRDPAFRDAENARRATWRLASRRKGATA